MQGISAKARLLSVDATLSNPPGYPKRAEGTHRAAGTSLLPKAKTSRHRFYMVPFREIATLRSQ